MKRFDRLEHILSLDPDDDCETIYRLLAELEFPWDITRALELALFRTYAVPSIGRLLDRTGQFTGCPQRRYDDTVLVLYEIFHGGAGSERGAAALAQLNTIHGAYRISNDDYLYTLATFVVVPVRWLAEFGWRELHPREVRAMTNTMRRLGDGMGLHDIPADYAEFERLLDDYERDRFGFDPGGRRVADATLDLLASWYPRPLAPLARRVPQLLMDPHLLEALGLPVPAPRPRALARAALRLRAGLVRLGPPRSAQRPVRPEPPSYPDGYRIDELGPSAVRRGRSGREHAVTPA
ncbi:oxygenase MpaB family protein [Saccharopolyspora sp. CA-218241]|uniref:oxygenase MpaB family protein n=1 Tax=Saccharopolyspora sp. CA-218241 TaxID=3240027 RepID=UPI003D98E04C